MAALRIEVMSKSVSESLFREQALKALSNRPFGRPIAVVPRPWSWLTGLVVVLAMATALFVSTAQYSRKERVRGWLVSDNGVARISHNTTGMVESIALTLGESVAAGDPLIYLSRDTYLENGRSSGGELIAELSKQCEAIDRRVELLRTESNIEQDSIAAQLQDLQKERKAISWRRKGQQRRLDVASDKLSRLVSAADHGAVSEWELMRQEDERAVQRQTLGQIQQNEMALDREHERLAARARSLPVETESSISILKSQRSELQQQIAQYESQRGLVLKSPIDGKFASLEVRQGSAVLPNQLLATIVSENLALVAEVFVPSSAIGFIKRGQHVRLIYDAFPQQQFGAFSGVVEYVSESILLPQEVPPTFHLREATFKIRIAIERDVVALKSGDAPLRPGMLLAAEIILESRSLIDWLLEPVLLRRKAAV